MLLSPPIALRSQHSSAAQATPQTARTCPNHPPSPGYQLFIKPTNRPWIFIHQFCGRVFLVEETWNELLIPDAVAVAVIWRIRRKIGVITIVVVVFSMALRRVVEPGFVITIGVFVAIVKVIGILVSKVGIVVIGVAAARPRATVAIHGGMPISDSEVSTSVLECEVLFPISFQMMGNHGFSYSDMNDMQNFQGFFVLSALACAC